MKSIIFLDLDGTLWENEIIPPSALEAIQKAKENGHMVFANTGRSRGSAWFALKELPLSGQVYSAGTEIWIGDKRIFFAPLGVEKTKRLVKALTDLDIGITLEGSFANSSNEQGRAMLEEFIRYNPHSLRPEENILELSEMKDEDFASIMKLMAFEADVEKLEPLLNQENMTFTFTPILGHELANGEITQKSMTKGTAFEEIRKYLDQDFRTIAIGDSENDLPMFEKADLAIAMGNASEQAKKAADWITSPIQENGLYNAFEYANLFSKEED